MAQLDLRNERVSFSTIRKTIEHSGHICGVGVHSGHKAHVAFSSAPEAVGIVFRRSDQGGASIKADWRNVTSTHYSTTIAENDVTVSTVEHLTAALWALGITDVYIDIDGPEVPILDGSALPWIQCLSDLGQQTVNGYCETLDLSGPTRITNSQGWIEIHPSSTLRVDMFVPLDNGSLQAFSYTEDQASFVDDISCARTFSFKQNIEAMRDRGFIRGGSLDNALVIHEGRSINELGFRQPNECARHKVLDFLGDWALCGKIFKGHVTGFSSGHALNHALLQNVHQAIYVARASTHMAFVQAPCPQTCHVPA